MTQTPGFDVAAAHKYFSAHCFNEAWKLIEKSERSPEEDRDMVALNQSSLYHWSRRDDCNDRALSIGYWQASRIQTLLNHPAEALRHAQVCLLYSETLAPFYLGYAHEALARAYGLAGNSEAASDHRKKALALVLQVSDDEDRELLLKDLEALQASA